jgi:putative proteasome-type protease
MTYCLAIHTNDGLVLCSDSRTNAGFDNISVYSKMHRFVWPGNRFITLLSSGNLATTQAVISKIRQDLNQFTHLNLQSVTSLHEAADYIAAISTDVQRNQAGRDAQALNYEATFILAGQIGQMPMETILIYPQGNFIFESESFPFLQIGEIKYGKPILDRVVKRDISLEAAARCALVSMNSTIRSNLTVGPPVELLVYKKNTLETYQYLLLDDQNTFAKKLSVAWDQGLTAALETLPHFSWESNTG